MLPYLFLASVIMLACVALYKFSDRIGVPALLAFIALGMFFGSDGVVKIPFENFEFAEQLCSIALIFIIFDGGFGTNWETARPAAGKSILLSTLSVVLTAGFVGVFCHFVLHMAWLESFLLGSVISSTDAASVFSILRSKRLNLKYNTASLLEVESGSNDPISYMLTVIVLSLMTGTTSQHGTAYLMFAQVVYGVLLGALIAWAAVRLLRTIRISSGMEIVCVTAIALLSYLIPTVLGGNGYLSVYLTGIILGNRKIGNKQGLVHFFDGITGLMQMVLFFLLGLLSFPSQLANVVLPALFIALFLTLVARPIAVFLLSAPFKCRLNQLALVSWAGMRGAASIVFAIMTVISSAFTKNDIFHMVFLIVLFSILIQGSMIPLVAKKLDMTDDGNDVMKTFNDYTDEFPIRYIQFTIPENHSWQGKMIKEIDLPPDCLLVLVLRNGKKIVPRGNTVIHSGDVLIMSGSATEETKGVNLSERVIEKGDELENKKICDIKEENKLIVMILRGKHTVIPKGNTTIRENDVLVINDYSENE